MEKALLALFLICCCLAAKPQTEQQKPDQQLLQGKWQVYCIEFGDGTTDTANDLGQMSYEFAGDKVIFTFAGDETETWGCTLKTDVNPKQLDIVALATLPAIYKFENGDLILAMTVGGTQRPTEFKALEKDELNIVVCKLKKVKR